MPAEPAARDVEAVLQAIADSARETGTEAYLVGGFVRDRLLGRSGKDIDVVTVGGDGLALLRHLAHGFGWSPPQVFPRFGTAQVRGGDVIVEVVRARAERYDPESRKPDVEPGTLEQDIWRRDFTVNALCQPVAGGDVLDLTGHGLTDLRDRVLRTPLDAAETFSEDPLRLFRAARFVAQLDFEPVPEMLAAMRQVAARSRILSVERIADELRRLLVCPRPDAGLRLLRDGGLLDAVLPELAATVGVEQGGWHRYDVFEHTAHAVQLATPASLMVRLGALFHDIGKPPTHQLDAAGRHTFHNHPTVGSRMTREVLTRLRFSREEVEQTCRLVELHMRPIQYRPDYSDSAVRRLIRDAGELREAMLSVARGDTLASNYPSVQLLDDLETRMAALDAGASVSRMRPALDGTAIMALAPERPAGPWVGGVIAALEEAVLEGDIPPNDQDAAQRWLLLRPELLSS